MIEAEKGPIKARVIEGCVEIWSISIVEATDNVVVIALKTTNNFIVGPGCHEPPGEWGIGLHEDTGALRKRSPTVIIFSGLPGPPNWRVVSDPHRVSALIVLVRRAGLNDEPIWKAQFKLIKAVEDAIDEDRLDDAAARLAELEAATPDHDSHPGVIRLRTMLFFLQPRDDE